MGQASYDTAQICLNGHIVNGATQASPAHSRDHCSKCGKKTITNCPTCNKAISGDCSEPVFHDFWSHQPNTPLGAYIEVTKLKSPPLYCDACGTPYPWTEAASEAANELAELELSEVNALVVKEALPDIMRETPRTTVAALKMKKALDSAGPVVGAMFRAVLVNVLSETAKRVLLS